MLLDFIYPAPLCHEEDDRPGVLKYIHYLYFSMMLSFITLVVVVVVSLATEEPKPEQVEPLYKTLDPLCCFINLHWLDSNQSWTNNSDIVIHSNLYKLMFLTKTITPYMNCIFYLLQIGYYKDKCLLLMITQQHY